MHPDREFHPVTEEGRRAQAECLAARDRIEAEMGRSLSYDAIHTPGRVAETPLAPCQVEPETRDAIALTLEELIEKHGLEAVAAGWARVCAADEGDRL